MVLPRIVSLFSGAGGLDLGFHQEGYEIAFAVDRMVAAIQTHKRNFPTTTSVAADITARSEPSGGLVILDEIAKVLKDGEAIGISGGPPCQGFSRANPNSRADDPRNQMPTYYLEIVEALQARYDVQFVLFETVMGIRDAKHSVTFRGILALQGVETHGRRRRPLGSRLRRAPDAEPSDHLGVQERGRGQSLQAKDHPSRGSRLDRAWHDRFPPSASVLLAESLSRRDPTSSEPLDDDSPVQAIQGRDRRTRAHQELPTPLVGQAKPDGGLWAP